MHESGDKYNPVTGNCSVTGYPRPNVKLIIPAKFDYQHNNVHFGNHINKAVFYHEYHKKL